MCVLHKVEEKGGVTKEDADLKLKTFECNQLHTYCVAPCIIGEKSCNVVDVQPRKKLETRKKHFEISRSRQE